MPRAGGLEAFEQFFTPVPVECGSAFVVIQHQDPTKPGMLVALLQRCTRLAVVQIADGMRLEPNHIYVIPPGFDLHVLHDVLHLMEPSEARGLRLPIDTFFRSMAADRGPASIAVVLSGMGSDGTLGLRAIKEQAGAVFVQSPESARYDSMPRSAIDHELADVIAAPSELYGHIAKYLAQLPSLIRKDADAPSESERIALDKIVLLLRTQTGQDFSQYKLSTLSRRIQRRMRLHHLKGVSDYVRYVRENRSEGDLLFRELLIGVTSFFRDADVWTQLRTRCCRRCSPRRQRANLPEPGLPRAPPARKPTRWPFVSGGDACHRCGYASERPDLRHRSGPRCDRRGARRASTRSTLKRMYRHRCSSAIS